MLNIKLKIQKQVNIKSFYIYGILPDKNILNLLLKAYLIIQMEQFLLYNITCKESFDGVKNQIKDAEPYGKFDSILCRNKINLEKKRELKIHSLKEYGLKKNNVFETSAKTGVKVNDAFEKLVDLIIKSKSHDELVRDFGVKQGLFILNLTKSNKKKNQNGGNCCNK